MQSQPFNGALGGASFDDTRGNNQQNERRQASASIGDVLASLGLSRGAGKPIGTRRMVGAPVRRNSYYAHDKRSTALWRPIAHNPRDARRLIAIRLKAAEWYNERNKQAGDRQGPIGDIGVRLLRELYRLVNFKTGRLEPAIETLCARVKRARSTVVIYLRKLKEHGFLDWVPRSEPTQNEGEAGPQVRQISNAYGFSLPRTAAAWVAKMLGNGPAPACELARQVAAREEFDAMLDQLSPGDQARTIVDNDELAEILGRMGDALSRSSASMMNG